MNNVQIINTDKYFSNNSLFQGIFTHQPGTEGTSIFRFPVPLVNEMFR